MSKGYNPRQPRDSDGKWTSSGAGGRTKSARTTGGGTVVKREYAPRSDRSKTSIITISPMGKGYVAGKKGARFSDSVSARGKTPALAYKALLRAGRGY